MRLPVLPARGGCRACELHEGVRSVGVPTVWLDTSLEPGPGVPAVVMLGQNPGLHEDNQNLPFVGPSGKMVRTVYLPPALQRLASFYLANTARCFTPSSSPPRQRHYNACFPHTLTDLQEILRCHIPSPSSPTSSASSPSSATGGPSGSSTWTSSGPCAGPSPASSSPSSPSPACSSARSTSPSAIPPTAIVCLGAPATFTCWRALTGKGLALGEAFKRNGQVTPLQVGDDRVEVHLFSTFHPAAVLRKMPLIHAVSGHLQLLCDFLEGVMASPSRPHLAAPRAPRWD